MAHDEHDFFTSALDMVGIEYSESAGEYSQFDIKDAHSQALLQNLAMKTVQDMHETENPIQRGVSNTIRFTLENASDDNVWVFKNALGSLGLTPKDEPCFRKNNHIISLPAAEADRFLKMMQDFDYDGAAVTPDYFYNRTRQYDAGLPQAQPSTP